jgi:hypothetical protein
VRIFNLNLQADSKTDLHLFVDSPGTSYTTLRAVELDSQLPVKLAFVNCREPAQALFEFSRHLDPHLQLLAPLYSGPTISSHLAAVCALPCSIFVFALYKINAYFFFGFYRISPACYITHPLIGSVARLSSRARENQGRDRRRFAKVAFVRSKDPFLFQLGSPHLE